MSGTKPPSKDGEQVFVPESVAARRASVMPPTFHKWVQRARTPNGWPLIVQQDIESKKFLVDERSVKRLETRFVYASSGMSVGPCSFNSHPPQRGPRTHFKYEKSKLFPLEEAFLSFEKQFGPERAAAFRTWCIEETGPGKNRMRPIRDSVTNKLYIAERSLSIAQASLRMMR